MNNAFYFILKALSVLKDTLKAFDDFKNKQKGVCFFICKSMYDLKLYSIHYTLR